MLDRFVRFFVSLRLTAVLLAFGILLVFVGTIAQADEGLYQAQVRYFKQWFVFGVSFFGHRVPVLLPGGYLLGSLLLVNLIASHIHRFEWGWKKLGIQLAHAGVILLLVGQLSTDLLSHETNLRFFEGQTKSYSESPRSFELAIVSDVDADTEEVVAIPTRLLTKGAELKHANLPFTLRVTDAWRNSDISFRAPMQTNAPALTTNGVARHFDFQRMAQTSSMDERDLPTAILEFVAPTGSLGTWVASAWSGDPGMVAGVRENYARRAGLEMGDAIAQKLSAPQAITVAGKEYTFTLRPERLYNRFALTLLKATHSLYAGTDIPKDFRSRVRLQNPQTGEDREVEIFMNSPLRYAGLTFYQYQMDAGEAVTSAGRVPSSVLQVVRNPGWLTPYAGCIIVALGLVVQFLTHLVRFVSRRTG
jgi:hypothetical protein